MDPSQIPIIATVILQLKEITSQLTLIFLLIYTYTKIIPRKDEKIADAINGLTKAVEKLEDKIEAA